MKTKEQITLEIWEKAATKEFPVTPEIWEKATKELQEAEFVFYYKYVVIYFAENKNWVINVRYGGWPEDVYDYEIYPGKKVKLAGSDYKDFLEVIIIDKKREIIYECFND